MLFLWEMKSMTICVPKVVFCQVWWFLVMWQYHLYSSQDWMSSVITRCSLDGNCPCVFLSLLHTAWCWQREGWAFTGPHFSQFASKLSADVQKWQKTMAGSLQFVAPERFVSCRPHNSVTNIECLSTDLTWKSCQNLGNLSDWTFCG
jgi:hypothetical protein